MFKTAAAALVLLGSVGWAAAATPQCLRSGEVEADQAMRYQAELMVVSDTCGAQTYTRFARRNREALVEYQKQMMEKFRRGGSPHAEARLDSYLTQLANEASLRFGAQPVAVMCRDHQEFLAMAETLNGESFRHYIASHATVRNTSYRLCRD